MNEELPLISVGMPVWNGARYIAQALDALCAQSESRFELIISDNASTDGTLEICERRAAQDSRIRILRNPENIGAAGNFRRTLDEARAPIFCWAAHDDLWQPDYLAAALALLADQEMMFAFPGFRLSSVRLPWFRRMPDRLFQFVRSADRRERVLGFINLHHSAHKCNLVYSVFRTEFLKSAIATQGIDDDGTLAAVLLGAGRGGVLDGHRFSKRYDLFWPGALNWIYRRTRKTESAGFCQAKKAALARLCRHFPEYAPEIERIFSGYKEFHHGCDYRILNS